MNDRAERINGWFAMIGVVAAMGAYALTGQVIPGVWWVPNKISICTYPHSKYEWGFFYCMPRNELSKEEIKCYVEKLKIELYNEGYTSDPKELAHKYLNQVLDKIQEYYRWSIIFLRFILWSL